MPDMNPRARGEQTSSIAPFLRNTASMIAGGLVRLVLQGAYFVVIARSLGADQFGAFSGVLALIAVLSPFASLGMGNLIIKSVSHDTTTFRDSWGNALCATGALSAGFLILVLLVSRLILPREISWLLVVFIGLSDMLLVNIVNLAGQAFQAFEHLHKTARVQVVLITARVAAALVLIVINHHPTAMLWSSFYFLGTAASALYSLIWVCRELGSPTLALGSLRRNVREGMYFSVSLSSQSIYNNIDKTMLTRLSTLDGTGIYTTAYRLIDLAFQPVSALLASTYSRFFHHGANGLAASTRFARRLLPFSMGYGVLAALGLVLAAPIVPHVLGESYARAVEAVWWLSPIIVLRSVHYFLADSLTGSGFQGVRTFIQLMVAGQNVLLNLWLIPTHGWRGAAWASLASDGMLMIGLALSILILSRKGQLAPVACIEQDAIS
jgi:O-antigen/teichoic acid export membrane protein